ncbi:MAG: trypsin-like serine protease [Nannocystaceae bacterium]|nr:trypsin-like serine protease [Nannocystaceae bacterium]
MPDEPEFRVELSTIHQYAEPAGNANPVSELAEMARGAILIPLRDSDGNQRTAADGTPMRASCGAIMVSPSYAVTAAHCVDNENVIDPYLHRLTLEMYAKDPALQTGYLTATNLTTSSSDWHDFQHPQLTASHGYHTERFTCRVVVRCGDSWGNLNCVPLHPAADVALIKCDGHPGNKYGHIDVADDDIDGAPVFMPWAHEVYAIDDEEGDGLFYDHYTRYTENKAENLHYFGDNRNQLVPLRSIPWEGETSNVKLNQWPAPPNDIRRWTDLSGCHGTSGSPVLQPDPDVPGQWQLLGPAINPNGPAWNNRLCADPDAQGPGSAHLAYAALRLTQQAVSGVNDCHELTQGKGLAFLTWCWLKDKQWMEFDPFPEIWCLSCGLIDWLRFINEPMAVIREESVELQVAIAGGVGTRIAMLATAAGDEPGTLSVVDAAGRVLAEAEVEPGSVAVLSAKLAEPIGGSIFVRSEGGAIGVTQVQVAASEATVQFTDAIERLGVGSASPDGLETPLVPMSFVSDPRGGFAALLEPGHRMIMTRSALVGGRAWSVGFTAAGQGRLLCGFILESGEEVVQDCRIRRGRVAVKFDRIEHTPVAFFIEALEAEAPIVIDDVSLIDGR